MEMREFAQRLSELRLQKGVSARDMSLSIGQSPGYINNIENGLNYPSMTAFFYICEYLGVSPQAFFQSEVRNPAKLNALLNICKDLSDGQIDNIIALAKDLKR